MLMTEIFQLKLFFRNLVHRGEAVPLDVIFRISLIYDIRLIISKLSTCTIRLELHPPIKRSCDVSVHIDHLHELPMIRTSVAKASHEFEIIGANHITDMGFCLLLHFALFTVTPLLKLIRHTVIAPFAEDWSVIAIALL